MPYTFVLVHGAWHGGWCWRRVADRLRAGGHAVFMPTLTGLGERAHLLRAGIDLKTHIADVVNVIKWEGLDDVVLVRAFLRRLHHLGRRRADGRGAALDGLSRCVRAARRRAVLDLTGPAVREAAAAARSAASWRSAAASRGVRGQPGGSGVGRPVCMPQPTGDVRGADRADRRGGRVARKAYVRAGPMPIRASPRARELQADPAWKQSFGRRAATTSWSICRGGCPRSCSKRRPE